MSYNTKKLFTKAISNVTKEFGSLNNEGDVEIDLPKSKRTTTQRIKDAFLEAGSQNYMEAYTNTLNILYSIKIEAEYLPDFSTVAIKFIKENQIEKFIHLNN